MTFCLNAEKEFDRIEKYDKRRKEKDAFLIPSSLRRRVMPMSTMEVLTLLLVIFSALTYIEEHKKK